MTTTTMTNTNDGRAVMGAMETWMLSHNDDDNDFLAFFNTNAMSSSERYNNDNTER